MDRKNSQAIVALEAIFFALPSTLLVALALTGLSVFYSTSHELPFWPWRVAYYARDLVTLLAAGATCAGWRLIVVAYRGGAEALRRTHLAWWLAASLGAALVLAAFVSKILPKSPPYSPAESFRDHLEMCLLGIPLVGIFGHLLLEALFRKTADNDETATRDDAPSN